MLPKREPVFSARQKALVLISFTKRTPAKSNLSSLVYEIRIGLCLSDFYLLFHQEIRDKTSLPVMNF